MNAEVKYLAGATADGWEVLKSRSRERDSPCFSVSRVCNCRKTPLSP